jgi:hypothetical protein
LPLTDDLKEVKNMVDAILEDGVVTPKESEKLIGLLKKVASSAFEEEASPATVALF